VESGVEEEQAQLLFKNDVNGATLLGWAEDSKEKIEARLKECGLSIGSIGALASAIKKLGGKLSLIFFISVSFALSFLSCSYIRNIPL
jgi:hypothetical protein